MGPTESGGGAGWVLGCTVNTGCQIREKTGILKEVSKIDARPKIAASVQSGLKPKLQRNVMGQKKMSMRSLNSLNRDVHLK